MLAHDHVIIDDQDGQFRVVESGHYGEALIVRNRKQKPPLPQAAISARLEGA
jgi:hypothetical protein